MYSPIVLAGGGGVAAAYPLAVVVRYSASVCPAGGRVRYSASVCPASRLKAVFWGKIAFDVVSLGVGPPCLQLDSEETLPALLDERRETSFTVPGVTSDGGPV